MENIVCEVCVIMCISASYIVTLVASFFDKFLKFRNDNVITALSVYSFSKMVMHFFSAVKAENYIMTFFVCKFNYIVINKHTVCCKCKTEVFVVFLFNASCIGNNLLYNIKVHKRFSAEEVNLKVYSAA